MPSQRNMIIGGSIAIVLMLVATGLIYIYLIGTVRNGFDTEDLTAPAIVYDAEIDPSLPTPLIGQATPRSLIMQWSITPVYAGYGGVLDLSIENTGNNYLFIYGFGVEWPDGTASTNRYANVTIEPGMEAEIGLLLFDAPADKASADYRVNIRLAAQNIDGTGWFDHGLLNGEWNAVELVPEHSFVNYTAKFNTASYFDKVNERVDFAAVSDIITQIDVNNETYNIQQVIAAFDWMRQNIEYLDDPEDNWQSTSETLALGSGDCEDQAILMASIVGALGGNARVNIVEEHAFATVYVGNSSWSILNIRTAISTHYGADLIPYFIKDSTGYWMTVDTTGFPYAGGLVTTSAPVSDGIHAWTFESSDWMVCIDAVGDQ